MSGKINPCIQAVKPLLRDPSTNNTLGNHGGSSKELYHHLGVEDLNGVVVKYIVKIRLILKVVLEGLV